MTYFERAGTFFGAFGLGVTFDGVGFFEVSSDSSEGDVGDLARLLCKGKFRKNCFANVIFLLHECFFFESCFANVIFLLHECFFLVEVIYYTSLAAFEVDGPAFEVDGPAFEVDGPAFEVDGPAFEEDGPAFEVGFAPGVRTFFALEASGTSGSSLFFLPSSSSEWRLG